VIEPTYFLTAATEAEPWNWGNTLALVAFLLAAAVGIVDWRRGRAAADRENDRDEFQKRIAEEQVEIQRKSYELALEVHQANLEPEPEPEPEPEEANAFSIRFAYRDSSRSWARFIATYHGSPEALEVELDVWFEKDDQTIVIDTIAGMDHSVADHLDPGQSVHVAFVFSLATPGPEYLRYKVTWLDPAIGFRVQTGNVPVDLT